MTDDTRAFVYCMLCAAALMALLDFFACVRRKVINAAAADFVMDVIWWFTAAVSVSVCLWESNSFSLRIYEAVSTALGIIIYKTLFSRAVKQIFCFILSVLVKIFAVIFKIIKRILKILLTPVLFLYKILSRGFDGSRQGGQQ